MTAEIRSLIEDLRRGNYEDPTEKIGLLAAALREKEVEPAFMVSLLGAEQIPLRLAALEACVDCQTPELHAAIAERAKDREARVRAKAAEVLASLPGKAGLGDLRALCEDREDDVRVAVLRATSGRPEFFQFHAVSLAEHPQWHVRMAAAHSLDAQADPAAGVGLVHALAHDADSDIRHRCAEALEARLGHDPAGTEKHLPVEIELLGAAEANLRVLSGRFPKLLAWLRAKTAGMVDPKALARFGTDLTALATAGNLPHAYCAAGAVASVMKLINREPRKSFVLLGESGVGKSALVNELVFELAKPEHGDWRVLRASPTDFMTDTKYTGEWETKVRDFVEAVRSPRRVLVYVPNISDLAAMGRWSKSDANVATALAPFLESGDVVLMGENTSDEFERGIGSTPSLERLFDKVLIPESGVEETREVLRGIRDEEKAQLSDEVLGQLQEVSDYFLGHLRRPGNAATLLRAVIGRHREAGKPVSFRDVLAVLSQSSGVPAKLLDDGLPLDTAEVRAFFEQRIIGQSEAVEAVVDLVTLIKAGLTDPNKPFGVFLFVGPTGVGKTELARALAEFIFGDGRRLLRFDMSEYASNNGFERLIGSPNENGLLTDAVRQQPFSVVLLDEIEKSHLNIFDLCLQIFDAGRLTDGRGRKVDFRRTIVILTSNIGAAMAGSPIGFGAGSQPVVAGVDKDQTFRELSRFFRPEFLNRLDRIINFQPLSLQVAERVARREVEAVLKRSGIVRRGLVVEVDPAALSLMVREGYSPHFGARPLKRTVERLCLLPLAQAISRGRVAPNSLLRLTTREGKVAVEITRADPPAVKVAEERRTPMSLRARELEERFAHLQPAVQAFDARKSELLLRTQQNGFYDNQVMRAATFDEIHKLDQFVRLHHRLGGALEKLKHRLARKPKPDDADVRQHAEQFEADLEHVESVTTCRDATDLGEALVCLTLVDREGEAQDGVERLARMYLGLSARRRLTAEVMAEHFDAKHDQAFLQVAGLGAFSMLKSEAGLHELNRRYRSHSARTGSEKEREDRERIRVEVLPFSGEADGRFVASVRSETRTLKLVRKRLLEKADILVSLFHEPSLRSLEVWAAGPRKAALERGQLILQTLVAANASGTTSGNDTVRRYELGVGSRIKDYRSGKSTPLVEQVFKGRLDLLARLSRTS